MLRHPTTRLAQLTEAQEEAILDAALEILQRTGLRVDSPEATAVLHRAGCPQGESGRVVFPRRLCEERLAQAPSQFALHARKPRYDVTLGGDRLLLSPGYGSAFVADAQGRRRNATLEDFRRFATLAAQSDLVNITGGLLVEPADVPPERRPQELTRALLDCSAKPLFGSVAGAEGARQSLEVVGEVAPALLDKPSVMGLININSPLRLDANMAGALLVYARAGQPIVLTPGIMMGITAPVTMAGALAQAFAELIGCVALTQAVRPGAPVVIGTGGFAGDLRTAASGFGRPEQALSTVAAAQLARRLNIPYRASPGVTGAFAPDIRAGGESMMTAFAAWSAGAHLAMQAFGILDHINAMSYEKFVVDLEMWGYLRRIAESLRVDEETIARQEIAALPRDYLSADHTLRHMRSELLTPALAPPLTYDAWRRHGAPDATALAHGRVDELSADHPPA